MSQSSELFVSVLVFLSGIFIFSRRNARSRGEAVLLSLLVLGLAAILRRPTAPNRYPLAKPMPHNLMPVPEKPSAITTTPATPPLPNDDLTIIEGIGAKMAAALAAAGITSFARLAKASQDELTEAIHTAGMRLAPSLPTWSEQAAYAARGDWDGLKTFQSKLVRGRYQE